MLKNNHETTQNNPHHLHNRIRSFIPAGPQCDFDKLHPSRSGRYPDHRHAIGGLPPNQSRVTQKVVKSPEKN